MSRTNQSSYQVRYLIPLCGLLLLLGGCAGTRPAGYGRDDPAGVPIPNVPADPGDGEQPGTGAPAPAEPGMSTTSDNTGGNPGGTSTTPPAGYTPVDAVRLVDSRGGGQPSSESTACYSVGGKYGVPADAAAVFVNIVAINASGPGYMAAFAKGSARPGTSVINYGTGSTVANGTIVRLGDGGQFCLYMYTATHLVIDLSGYFPAGGKYVPIEPYRRMDSRSGAPLSGDSTVCVKVAGEQGVPANAKAVALNLAAVAATSPGYLTAYAQGENRPETSNVNYGSGANAAAGAVVAVGTSGEVCVYSLGSTHLIVDVVGYFAAGAAYQPLVPFRRLDTRGAAMGGQDSENCIQVAGKNGIPSSARVVAVGLTAVSAQAPGYLATYPDGQGLPDTSTLNYNPATEAARANNALIKVGVAGRICIYSFMPTHYILDIVGFW